MTWGCVKTLTSGQSGKVKVTGRRTQNSFLAHIFLMEENCEFLLHTKIVDDLEVCHDLDLSSFRQGKGHW